MTASCPVPVRLPQRARVRARAGAGGVVAVIAVALLAGGCSCDGTDPWRATYISTAEAAAISPPACDVEAQAAAATAQASGAQVDPDLVEIARLEVERDCYKGAEESLRLSLKSRPPALK